MAVIGTPSSVTAPAETNNELGGIATGLGVSPKGNTRDQQFTHGVIAQDCDVGPGFVGNISPVDAPTN